VVEFMICGGQLPHGAPSWRQAVEKRLEEWSTNMQNGRPRMSTGGSPTAHIHWSIWLFKTKEWSDLAYVDIEAPRWSTTHGSRVDFLVGLSLVDGNQEPVE